MTAPKDTIYPDTLKIRDTGIYEDSGRRIHTTAGMGYPRTEYTRSDLIPALLAEARNEDTQAREIMAKTIGELLTRVDEAYTPPEGHLSMHTYGQTPDWFVEAAYQACYAKPTEHAIAEHRVALKGEPT